MNRIKRVSAVLISLVLLILVSISIPKWMSLPGMEPSGSVSEIDEQEAEEAQSPPSEMLEEDATKNKTEVVEKNQDSNLGATDNPSSETMVKDEASWAGEVDKLLDGVSGINEEWVQNKVEKYRDEIEQEDLEVGLAILDKIDANYLYEMSENGFTEEEKIDAENFLYSELPEQDIETILDLMNKYMELVD